MDPLPGRAPEWPVTNMLMMLAVGDDTVVFAQGLALARSIGLLGRGTDLGKAYSDPMSVQVDPGAPYRAWTEQVIALGILTSNDVPPPLLNPARPDGGKGTGLCSIVPSVLGPGGVLGNTVSGLCLADVHGHHEYIAQAGKDDSFPHVDGYAGTYTEYHRNLIATYLHSLATHVTENPCWGDPKCVEAQNLRAEWDLPLGKTAP